MKFGNLEVNPRTFYTAGCILFGIVAIMNTYTTVLMFNRLLPSQNISAIASNLFSYFLFGFFYYLRNQLPPPVKNPATEDEIIKMMGAKP